MNLEGLYNTFKVNLYNECNWTETSVCILRVSYVSTQFMVSLIDVIKVIFYPPVEDVRSTLYKIHSTMYDANVLVTYAYTNLDTECDMFQPRQLTPMIDAKTLDIILTHCSECPAYGPWHMILNAFINKCVPCIKQALSYAVMNEEHMPPDADQRNNNTRNNNRYVRHLDVQRLENQVHFSRLELKEREFAFAHTVLQATRGSDDALIRNLGHRYWTNALTALVCSSRPSPVNTTSGDAPASGESGTSSSSTDDDDVVY